MMHTERWRSLCAQAAVEKDPEKLLALVNEVIAILQAREKALASRWPSRHMLKVPEDSSTTTGAPQKQETQSPGIQLGD